MRFCFVSTSRGSYFMSELLAALATATEAGGHEVELVFDEFPPLVEGCVYVVVPHEFEAWGRRGGYPEPEQRAQTIALCTENPGTQWFEATYRLVGDFGGAVSINRSSAAELRRRGIRCEHIQLGYFAGWDSWHRAVDSERPIDVLYLGAADQRRDPLLAGIGSSLWARECQFLVPPIEPRTGPRADFLTEAEKYERLRRSEVLLNLHRTTSAAFEWMRLLEAICNGAVVISEPSLDAAPLVAGEHFVEASAEGIARTTEALLDDPDRLRALRVGAYDFARERLPMAAASERLVELAARLPHGPPQRLASAPQPSSSAQAATQASAAPPAEGAARPAHLRASAARSGSLAKLESGTARRAGRTLRRAASARLLGRWQLSAQTPARTPAYASARPRVSVLCFIAPTREREGLALLDRVAVSVDEDVELLLAYERATRSERAARRFVRSYPELPALALPVTPGGSGNARNRLAERARGEYLLVLPAAGGIFPTTVRRLVRALEDDAEAFFSYPMVAVFDGRAAVELRGSLPWERQRLARANWIDTPALIKRERLRELGAWSTDPALSGLEDFELWCRCAEAGWHGAHVSQVLAWHPPGDDSPPRDVATIEPTSIALLRERFPRLFAVDPGR